MTDKQAEAVGKLLGVVVVGAVIVWLVYEGTKNWWLAIAAGVFYGKT